MARCRWRSTGRSAGQQTPHTRDEVYVVVSGSGEFVNDGVRRPFEAGELLFVPPGSSTVSRISATTSPPG